MKIGIDASNIQIGGGVTHLIELLNKSDPKKHEFDQIVIWSNISILSRISDKPWIEKKNSKVLNSSLFYRLFWQIFQLKAAAISENCDILFTPGGNNLSGFQPSVSMCRNMLPFEWRELSRFGLSFKSLKLILLRFSQLSSFKRSTGLIFLTKYAEERIKPLFQFDNTITEIIPHGISERFFFLPKMQKEKKDFKLSDPCKILYISIVELYKHQWNVVKAVSMLREKGLAIELTLVGSFSSGKKKLLNELKKNNNYKEYIKILGGLPYSDLHQLYVNSDICVFASSCENMPNILLEGMASGLPIACSNLGPMPEILKDGGVYFNPQNPVEIANAIQILFESKQLRDKLATVSSQYAKNYSWDSCANNTFKFLKDIKKAT
jgi:glycosyltransferase involved in cell wall biosynthesis